MGLGHVYAAQSRYEQALAEFRMPGVRPEFTVWALAQSGKHSEARHALAEVLAGKPQSLGSVELALTHALLGEKDRAFEYLEKAYERHEWSMIFLNVYPMFDLLRSDARFTNLVNRMNFPSLGTADRAFIHR